VSTQLQQQDRGAYLTRVAGKGVWLLPAFGLLLALSTIRQQPPVQTDFEGYARFVTTGEFLVSHLVSSIGGAALAILGVCSVFVLLAGGRFRRAALIGTIITVIAQVYLASAFGSAAFVQPGIGRAYLRGEAVAAQALNADTAYGPAFMATAGFAVLLWLIGTVFLVVALVRTSPRLRVAGIVYGLSAPLFIWSGQVDLIPLQQALAGLLLTVAAVIIAVRLPRKPHDGEMARGSTRRNARRFGVPRDVVRRSACGSAGVEIFAEGAADDLRDAGVVPCGA
jgi:hypothetical protein